MKKSGQANFNPIIVLFLTQGSTNDNFVKKSFQSYYSLIFNLRIFQY